MKGTHRARGVALVHVARTERFDAAPFRDAVDLGAPNDPAGATNAPSFHLTLVDDPLDGSRRDLEQFGGLRNGHDLWKAGVVCSWHGSDRTRPLRDSANVFARSRHLFYCEISQHHVES